MTTNSDTILIVEDDHNTAALVATYLEKEGFAAVHIAEGNRAVDTVRRVKPVLVILDIMLPGKDGWDICRELRKESDVPVLMLTAREEEIDRIMGLSLGADDYVVKPYSPRELVERVKAILRRTRARIKEREADILIYRDLLLDPVKCKVSLRGKPVNLTLSEFKLLHALMSSPGRVFTRDALLARFYEHGESVVERVIDVHIGNLRQKVEDNPAEPKMIETVRGFGYRFVESDEGE